MAIETIARRPLASSLLALFILLVLYLGWSAPAALPDGAAGERRIPASVALSVLNAENAAIRALYTAEVVGAGKAVGLQFDERWKAEDVHAGPLPALLLRETANRLQARMPELGLFLGSDYPIVKENLFKGQQASLYAEMKRDLRPREFYDPQLKRTTMMFVDMASAQACVSCHNEHPNTPKKDWKLNEPMGATTWSYSGQTVSPLQLLRMVRELRGSAIDAYAAYLTKAASWDEAERPRIGSRWPREGERYLPDEATFRQAVEARNSADTFRTLLSLTESKPAASAGNPRSGAASGSLSDQQRLQ